MRRGKPGRSGVEHFVYPSNTGPNIIRFTVNLFGLLDKQLIIFILLAFHRLPDHHDVWRCVLRAFGLALWLFCSMASPNRIAWSSGHT